MTQIYKVAHLKNNEIINLYVFIGNKLQGAEYDKEYLNKLFKENPKDTTFSSIFDADYLENNIGKETNVEFINETINNDDTIETIKKKILLATNVNFSFYEMYLFIKQNTRLNANNVYQNLTQNNKLELTKIRLTEFLHNINKTNLLETLDDKEGYSFNDIMDLKINDREFFVNKSISHKFVLKDTKFPHFVNPYDVTEYDDFLDQNANNIVTTTNNNLLMNFGSFDNTIYMCIADDVLEYVIEKNLSELSTIKIYYPFLFDKNIKSQNMLTKNKEEFLIDTNNMITEKFKLSIYNLEYLNEIYSTNKTNLSYLEKGIKSIKFVIHPDSSFKLPLDVVFKLVNTTKQIPLIKYNPGKKQEKMYRLYSNKLATNGKKIPYLDKFKIFRLIKNIGTSKCVSLYIEYLFENNNIPIICEFIANGDIIINIEFDSPYDNIDKIIKESVNSVIDKIKEYILQSGYRINNFESIEDSNIEIIDLEYFYKLNIKKVIDLKKIMHCVSSVFRVSKFDVSQGAEMRYKRVENYNEMDDQEALISDLINQGKNGDEIVEILQNNFSLKQSEALDKLNSVISSLQAVQNAFSSSKIKTKPSPGFKTLIEKDTYNNISISVIGIDNINYIRTISKYIDVLINISQNSDLVNKCKKIQDEDDAVIVEDIVNEELETRPDIVNNELIFTNIDDNRETELDEDLFFGEEEESEEESDEEKEELPDDYGGGSNNDKNYEINLDNISLRDYFSKRMRTRDKDLFVIEGEGNMNAYSRSCPSQYRKQPVILTHEELEKIDKEHPGSYHEKIKYGSSPDKEHWYICPRYWSIKDNTSLTEEEAKSGKYGNIIPLGSKKIPKGANVYEFSSEKYHLNEDGTYKKHYPGFQKPNPNNKGLCAPCCFTSFTGNQQINRRKQCLKNDEEQDDSNDNKKALKEEDYIKGPEKFPLQENRYGYLPPAVETFLKTDNKLCYISSNNTNLRLNHECILRKGVENNKTQSFIACISDIFYNESDDTKSTIVEMKEKLIESLNYDKFIKLQNGNLIRIFDDSTNNDITDDFKKSKIYNKLKSNNPESNIYFKKVISAYNNFISYLRDNEVYIDHTYLWDLICMEDGFKHKGYNMVILEIIDDDITDKIDILCPSNTYSTTLFNNQKETFILLKNKNYFEPIYTRKIDKDFKQTVKMFDNQSLPNIKETFELIKNSYKNCEGLSSMPNIYKFKKNIMLNKLVDKLRIKSFQITKFIFNYNGKVIAVEASKDNKKGIIPCFPSAPVINLDDIEYIWIYDLTGYSYSNTLEFLKYVNNKIQDLHTKTNIKIVEDEMIIGVITDTNQFIPINPPEPNFDDDLKTISSSNYLEVDKTVFTDDNIDVERINYIKRIKLESGFYKIFRNIIRSMLGEYENSETRTKIQEIINSKDYYYVDKIERIKTLLIKMASDYFEFTDMDDKLLLDIDDVKNCYKRDINDEDEHFYCFVDDNNEQHMMLPNTSIVNSESNKSNKEVYFGKISDELVRYNRIKSFIFEPKSFITLSNIDYNLHDNEIILLESLLSNEYFEDIRETQSNKYVTKNTFDTTQPIQSQKYSNEVNSVSINNDENDCELKPTVNLHGRWFKNFPKDSRYIEYTEDSPTCAFKLLIKLLGMVDNTLSLITEKDVKDILSDNYNELSKKYLESILNILSEQGKKKYVNTLRNKTITFDDMVNNKDYYISNLDILILTNHFKIPLVLFSDANLQECVKVKNKSKKIYVSDEKTEYYFIYFEQVKMKPMYKLVILDDSKLKIPLSRLTQSFKNEITGNIKPDIFNVMFEKYKQTKMKMKPPASVKKTDKKTVLK